MRRRILLLVVGMTVLVVLAFAVPLAVLIRNNAYDEGLDGLRKEANAIGAFLRSANTAQTSTAITDHLAGLDDDRDASVQLADGTVLGRAPAGVTALSPFDGAMRGDGGRRFGGPGGGELPAETFRDGRLVTLRVPLPETGGDDGGGFDPSGFYTVRVYADDDSLHAGENAPLLLLAGASIALLLLGAGLGELLTRRIVRPLVHTAETAQALAAGDVTARATTSGPDEVAEVGRALNRLADRIDQLIADERETVADLSHRLRTPMTALRLDAEALRDPVEAERVGAHVSTLERMLTAVIRAARRPQREGRLPSCDATAVVGERIRFWSALAEDQDRTATVTLPTGPLVVSAGDEDLGAAVDALLENVIAHTPEGTAFSVALRAHPAGAVLEIADEGPGLPFEAPVRGRSDRGSSGLGLDIARRCAESSGGSMTLGTAPAGGALVTLVLGSAAA